MKMKALQINNYMNYKFVMEKKHLQVACKIDR